MASLFSVQRAFAGGELSPLMFGRFGDAKYQAGLAKCLNFITTPYGPAHNRGGLAFVRRCKLAAKKCRLLPFVYSTDQSMLIELGEHYIRFHSEGQTLVNTNAAPYEIQSPYPEGDLFGLHFVQSADVLTLVHENHAPHELRRLGALNWQLLPILFASSLAVPAAPTAVASGHTAVKYQYSYAVTAVSLDGKDESEPSPAVTVGGNLYETGGKVTLSLQAVAGASRYNLYKMQGGLFGYIGQTDTLSLVDDNIEPDLSKTPPRFDPLFELPGDYPGAVSYFEQRRCFAGSLNQPLNLWLTRSGTESNMSYSLPSLAEDRIALRVAAREASRIRHIVPLNQIILLTASGEWLVSTVDSDALTNSTISVRPQSYIGASDVQPVVINNSLIYCAARGGHLRELGYNWQAGGFISGDLSLRAAHLFDDLHIVDLAHSQAPFPIVWAVSSDGQLLGLTYLPEEDIGGWHRHATQGGAFESVAVIPEGGRDVLYAVIRRTLNGQVVRTIERMAGRHEDNSAFYVDCGASLNSATPVTHISGLEWLEGETVLILADGAPQPPQQVKNASITLEAAAKTVHVGLPIEAELHTLPLTFELQDGSAGSGKRKNVNQVWLRVQRTAGFAAGPKDGRLTHYKARHDEAYGSPSALKDELLNLVIAGRWGDDGQVIIRHGAPLPFTAVSLTFEVAIG